MNRPIYFKGFVLNTFCEEVAFEKDKSEENEKQPFRCWHILSTNWLSAFSHYWKLDDLGLGNQRKCFFFSDLSILDKIVIDL